jgi:acetyl esterase
MEQPDYQRLIDPEIRAFIDRTNACYPADTATADAATQRVIYDKMCAVFWQPYPPGVIVRDEQGPVPLRIYETATSSGTTMYFHGGGFVVGGLHSHDDVCAEICARSGLRVVAVDYRLAPEHRHPAAFDDALASSHLIAARYGALLLAGDSAGGTLAASVAHALRGQDVSIAGMVLIYPGLGGDLNSPSMRFHANAPMLSAADVQSYRALRGGSPADPAAGVLQDCDFRNLPPAHIFSAECDPLCDDGRAYAERITAAGGKAQFQLDTGLVHGWLRARHMSSKANDAFARIIRSFTVLTAKDRPTA